MTLREALRLEEGTPVVWNGKEYAFGYLNRSEDAVLYLPGERNMQDSFVVPLEQVELK